MMKKMYLFSLLIAISVTACSNKIDLNQSTENLYQQGLAYYYGVNGFKRDYNAAFQYLNEASKQGNIDAMTSLAVMYDNGESVIQDKQRAKTLYEIAAKKNNPTALYNLALWYYENEPNQEITNNLLDKAAKLNNSQALILLGKKNYDQKQYKTAHSYFMKASELNDSDADYYLGWMNELGLGIPKNRQKALDYYQQSAKSGNHEAQFLLGAMYLEGKNVEKDEKIALNWFEKSAEAGNTKALFNLAMMNAKGIGTSVNMQKAHELFKAAADRGDDKSQIILQNYKKI